MLAASHLNNQQQKQQHIEGEKTKIRTTNLTINKSNSITNCRRIALAEGLEAYAARIIAGVLDAPFNEGGGRLQLALHLQSLIHLQTAKETERDQLRIRRNQPLKDTKVGTFIHNSEYSKRAPRSKPRISQ